MLQVRVVLQRLQLVLERVEARLRWYAVNWYSGSVGIQSVVCLEV